jgi:2,4-dienoyl-CoA reductase-like NADH-dependent reductase (Old Yellow Enzyme family)
MPNKARDRWPRSCVELEAETGSKPVPEEGRAISDKTFTPANSLLLSPLHVGKTHLRNRIVLPPMKTNMDLAGPQALAYYRVRAEGGAGLVIVEATPLDQFEDGSLDAGLPGLASAIHEAGASAVVQLFHPDRIGGKRVAPSTIDDTRAATTEEVAAIPGRFASAALACRQAGFDGAEVHGAHDYFLNRFFSPAHNQRRDEYGGSLEKRMRLGLECARAVRRACGADFLVLYRHTAVADYPLDDSLVFAEELGRAGVDIIDISPSTSQEGSKHADLAAAVKSSVSCPVIAVGEMEDPEAAEAVLAEGKADLIAIGRALIADPDLPRKIMDGRREEIIECIKCDEKCVGALETGVPIGCSQNPRVGEEHKSN